MSNYPKEFKDPDEVRQFTIGWTNDLVSGDTISSSSFAADSGITVDSETNTTLTASVTLSGGTAGEVYNIVNTVITAGGETLEKTIQIEIREA